MCNRLLNTHLSYAQHAFEGRVEYFQHGELKVTLIQYDKDIIFKGNSVSQKHPFLVLVQAGRFSSISLQIHYKHYLYIVKKSITQKADSKFSRFYYIFLLCFANLLIFAITKKDRLVVSGARSSPIGKLHYSVMSLIKVVIASNLFDCFLRIILVKNKHL